MIDLPKEERKAAREESSAIFLRNYADGLEPEAATVIASLIARGYVTLRAHTNDPNKSQLVLTSKGLWREATRMANDMDKHNPLGLTSAQLDLILWALQHAALARSAPADLKAIGDIATILEKRKAEIPNQR